MKLALSAFLIFALAAPAFAADLAPTSVAQSADFQFQAQSMVNSLRQQRNELADQVVQLQAQIALMQKQLSAKADPAPAAKK